MSPINFLAIIVLACMAGFTGALFTVTSGAQYCQLNAQGCVTDGAGDYGHNENCTIQVASAATVTATPYIVESSHDYLTVNGEQYRTSGTGPSNVLVAANGVITWHSDGSRAADGFVLCEVPQPPPLVDVPRIVTPATQYNLRLEKQTSGDFVTGTGSSRGVAMGDINGDGRNDVVVANVGANELYLGNAAGGLTRQTSGDFMTGTAYSSGVAMGDINGDGRDDVVVANWGGANDLYLGNAAGGLTRQTSGDFVNGTANSRGVAMGDINGDGRDDVVVINYNAANELYLGNAAGGLTRQTSGDFVNGTAYSSGVAMGDINGDGRDDVVVANVGGANDRGANELYLGNAAGGLTRQTSGDFVTGTGESRDVAMGDINGDGRNDVVVANDRGANELYLGNAAGGLTRQTSGDFMTGTANSFGVAMGDINGDGRDDVVVANYNVGGANELYLGNAAGGLTRQTSGDFMTGTADSRGVAMGDINGDNQSDVVVANYNAVNELYLGNAAGGLMEQTSGDFVTGTAGSRGVAMGDINGDGRDDVVVASYNAANELYLGNAAGGLTRQTSGDFMTGTGHSFGVAMGDINGDNQSDVVVANYNAANELYLGNAAGGLTRQTSGDFMTGTADSRGVAMGDINGDGRDDVVVANWGGANELYLGNATGGLTRQTSGDFMTGTANSRGVAMGDINGDGWVNVVVANDNAANELYLGNAAGGLTRQTSGDFMTGTANSRGVAMGDINGDGRDDVVVASSNAVNELYLGNATGGLTRQTSGDFMTGTADSRGVAMGDINGDGRDDVVVANVGGANELYLGNAAGGLTRQTSGDFMTGTAYSSGVAMGDINSDGRDDVVVANVGGANQMFYSDPCSNGLALSNISSDGGTCYECPGYATDADANQPSKCLMCPAGTVGPAGLRGISYDQRYLCIPCAAGKFRPAALLTHSCAECPPGRYATAGAEQCTDCPIGQATNVPGVGACTACEAGKQPNANRTSCTSCSGAKYSQFGIACQECLSPNVVDAQYTSCNQPFKCNPGFTCPASATCTAATDCTRCPSGTVSSGDACVACTDQGKVTNDAQSACEGCSAGTEPNAARSNCTSCTGATYSQFGVRCVACDKVTNAPLHTACTACAAGRGPNAEATACEACVGANYSISGTCTECPTPSIVNSAKTTCSACAPGKQPNAARSNCTSCTGATYSQFGVQCVACDKVTNAPLHTACTACAAGRGPNVEATACEACVGANYSISGTCTECPQPNVVDSAKTSCSKCDSGKEPMANHSGCAACAGATYSEFGASCVACDKVTNAPLHTACTACAAGRGPNAEATACEACVGANYSISGTCTECPTPSIVNSAKTTCSACAPGKQPNAARSNCTSCTGATYSQFGVQCVACDKVTNAPLHTACTACAAGRGPNAEATACEACVGANYSISGTCTECPTPSIVNSAKTTCSACAPGKQPNAARSNCTSCTGATYSQFGIACQMCQSPAVVDAQRTSCNTPFRCNPGFTCAASATCTAATDCIRCPAGTISSGGACSACTDQGKVANAVQSACEGCPAGTEPNAARSNCSKCTGTKYSQFGIACASCTDGTQPYSAIRCDACREGRAGRGGNCSLLCNDGEEQNSAKTQCQPCPTGRAGSSGRCDQICVAGQMASASRNDCVGCSVGTAGTGGVCNPCASGKQPNTGLTACEPCVAGRAGASGICSQCPAGKQPNTAQSACEKCPVGRAGTNGTCETCVEHSQPSENQRYCICNDGYKKQDTKCIDINECATGDGVCPTYAGNATSDCDLYNPEVAFQYNQRGKKHCACCHRLSTGCTNRVGYFECGSCHIGFVGRGYGHSGCRAVTSEVNAPQRGCDGVFVEKGGALAVVDACGICAGDNSSCADCRGVPQGGASIDKCGKCNVNSSAACIADCRGVWGGSLVVDVCSACGGNGSSCADCRGEAHGNATVDKCGRCDSPNALCQADCAGIWGGPQQIDACGTCGGSGVCVEVIRVSIDISGGSGVCNQRSVLVEAVAQDKGLPMTSVQMTSCSVDSVGITILTFELTVETVNRRRMQPSNVIYGLNLTSSVVRVTGVNQSTVRQSEPEIVPMDCKGVVGGSASIDACGVCANSIYVNSTCADCRGVPNGGASRDKCGECNVDSSAACTADCHGVWGGPVVIDACDVCGGDNLTCVDCLGVPYGNATRDKCGDCRGNIDSHCVRDCAGAWGGASTRDMCGVCDSNVANDPSDCSSCYADVGISVTNTKTADSNAILTLVSTGMVGPADISAAMANTIVPFVNATCVGIEVMNEPLRRLTDVNILYFVLNAARLRKLGQTVASALAMLDAEAQRGALHGLAHQSVYSNITMRCPAGRVVDSTQGAACAFCWPGSEPNTEQSGCSKCTDRIIVGSQETWYSNEGATEGFCRLCPAGKYPNNASSDCKSCPYPKVSSGRGENCQLCSAGQGPSKGFSDCRMCSPGQYSRFGVCEQCLVPNQENDERTSCGAAPNCPVGYARPQHSLECSQCAQGYYSYGNYTICRPCKTIAINPFKNRMHVSAESIEAKLADPATCPGGERPHNDHNHRVLANQPTTGGSTVVTNFSVVVPIAGVWVHINKNMEVELLPCESAHACEERKNGLQILKTLPGSFPSAHCGKNLEGFMCTACESGYVKLNFECYECQEDKFNLFALFQWFCIVLLAGAFLLHKSTTPIPIHIDLLWNKLVSLNEGAAAMASEGGSGAIPRRLTRSDKTDDNNNASGDQCLNLSDVRAVLLLAGEETATLDPKQFPDELRQSPEQKGLHLMGTLGELNGQYWERRAETNESHDFWNEGRPHYSRSTSSSVGHLFQIKDGSWVLGMNFVKDVDPDRWHKTPGVVARLGESVTSIGMTSQVLVQDKQRFEVLRTTPNSELGQLKPFLWEYCTETAQAQYDARLHNGIGANSMDIVEQPAPQPSPTMISEQTTVVARSLYLFPLYRNTNVVSDQALLARYCKYRDPGNTEVTASWRAQVWSTRPCCKSDSKDSTDPKDSEQEFCTTCVDKNTFLRVQGEKQNSALFGIMTFFVQTCSLIIKRAGIANQALEILQPSGWLASVINLGSLDTDAILECVTPLDYIQHYYAAHVSKTIVAGLGIVLCRPLWNFLRAHKLPCGGFISWQKMRSPPQTTSEVTGRALLNLYLFLYAPVTRKSIEMLACKTNCEQCSDDGVSECSNCGVVNLFDGQIVCWEGAHKLASILATIVMFTFCCVIPAVLVKQAWHEYTQRREALKLNRKDGTTFFHHFADNRDKDHINEEDVTQLLQELGKDSEPEDVHKIFQYRRDMQLNVITEPEFLLWWSSNLLDGTRPTPYDVLFATEVRDDRRQRGLQRPFWFVWTLMLKTLINVLFSFADASDWHRWLTLLLGASLCMLTVFQPYTLSKDQILEAINIVSLMCLIHIASLPNTDDNSDLGWRKWALVSFALLCTPVLAFTVTSVRSNISSAPEKLSRESFTKGEYVHIQSAGKGSCWQWFCCLLICRSDDKDRTARIIAVHVDGSYDVRYVGNIERHVHRYVGNIERHVHAYRLSSTKQGKHWRQLNTDMDKAETQLGQGTTQSTPLADSPFQTPLTMAARPAVLAAFGRIDRNGDGVCSRAELIKALRTDEELRVLLQLPARMREGDTRAAFEAAFQGMDVNDDRAVTAEEFVGFVLAREQKLSRGAPANVTKLAEITVGLSV